MNARLSPSQAAAVESTSEITAVSSGPGSGKTHVFVERVAYVIDHFRAHPNNIVALTFTNAGANEFARRIRERGLPGELGYTGTLHGWCFRLLQRFGSKIGYNSTVSLITEEQGEELRREIVSLFAPKIKARDLNEKTTHDARLVWAEYAHRLKLSNVVDYDGVLAAGAQLVRYAEEISDFMVDEVQDSGELDWAVYNNVRALRKFYVGDPDQSIYGFRGANPDLFTGLPHAAWFTIEDNYRCRESICVAANNLIANNPFRADKRTRTVSGGVWVGISDYRRFSSESREAMGILDLINGNKDLAFPEMAVLTRNNDLAASIRRVLIEDGIPVKYTAKEEDPSDWPLCLATLAVLHDPRNNIVMERWMILNGRNPAEVRTLRRTAEAGKRRLIDEFPLPEYMEQAVEYARHSPAIALATIIGFDGGISKASAERVAERIAIMGEPTFGDLLQSLWKSGETWKTEGEGITVSTIHGAKGQEWPMVIVAGMEEGTLPGRTVEEDRRLCFVAFTRAQDELILTSADVRWKYGKPETMTPSRFIKEAGL